MGFEGLESWPPAHYLKAPFFSALHINSCSTLHNARHADRGALALVCWLVITDWRARSWGRGTSGRGQRVENGETRAGDKGLGTIVVEIVRPKAGPRGRRAGAAGRAAGTKG